jgi:hypothetical protein
VIRARFDNRENGAKPAEGPHASPDTRDASPALSANGRQGHAAAVSLLRLLSVRARTAARPNSRDLTRRQLTQLSSWEELQREIDRSRRYEHSFSIVRLTSRATSRRAFDRHEERRAELEQRALTLGVLLRKLDRVWADGEDIYLLLPEGGRAMAESMLDRISEPLAALMPDCEAAIAAFPDDGLSKGALLAALGSANVRQVAVSAVEGNNVPAGPTATPETSAHHATG